MDKLLQYASKGDVTSLIATAEDYELTMLDKMPSSFYSLLALAYLVNGDIVNSRFAIRRSSDREAVSGVLVALWNRKFDTAIAALAVLPNVGILNSLLRSAIIRRVIAAHQLAFTIYSSKDVADSLGLSESEVLQVAESTPVVPSPSKGWGASRLEKINEVSLALREE